MFTPLIVLYQIVNNYYAEGIQSYTNTASGHCFTVARQNAPASMVLVYALPYSTIDAANEFIVVGHVINIPWMSANQVENLDVCIRTCIHVCLHM